MTKTKFVPDILKRGSNNGAILDAIASHNEGLVPLCLEDFISYAQFTRAKFPSGDKGFYIERDDAENYLLRVSEDDCKTWTMTIEERIIHELDPLPANETQGEIRP